MVPIFMLLFFFWLTVRVWVHYMEGLFGNVHRKGYSSI